MKCDSCGIVFDELDEKHYVSSDGIEWKIEEHGSEKQSNLRYTWICPKCGCQYYDGLSKFEIEIIRDLREDGMSETEICQFMKET